MLYDLIAIDRYIFLNKVINGEITSFEPNFIVSYLSLLKSDMENTLSRIVSSSRIDNFTQGKMKLNFVYNDDSIFDAYAKFQNEANVQLLTSQGLWQSFDDLFFRLSCNLDFYSKEVIKNERLWNGCKCLWLSHGILSPVYRYFDYRANLTAIPENIDDPFGGNPFYTMSYFYRGIPYDRDRILISIFMSFTATMWVYMHEEAHYWSGHLHYFNEKLKGFSSLSEINLEFREELINFNRVFEWEADREATRAVIQVLCRNKYLNILPDYCKNEPSWFVRLIANSIGCACLIFQKVREIKGQSIMYPSPITRLVSNILAVISEVSQRELDWLKFDQDFLDSLIPGIVDDLYIASQFLNEELDGFQPNKEYFKNKKEPNTLDFIIGNDTSGLAKGLLLSIYGQLHNPKFNLDTSIYKKYFAEWETTVKYQEQVVFNQLYEYRKLTSTGKTYYGE